ncbi:MAG: hypothetical protein Q8L80_06315 [Gallionella sp.]|nr:hypothetical protein [Gallionella sp.]MDP1940481.1 hypothetical protein [Gallionella sp.]
MSDLSVLKRNPLAADTEPTDEEMAEVMSEALGLAMARKQKSDAWMRHKLAEAVADARTRVSVTASR